MRFHHIAIVVKNDLESAVNFYTAVLNTNQVEETIFMDTKLVMINARDFSIELVYPLSEKSIAANDPEGFRHIVFLTDNLDNVLNIVNTVEPQAIKEHKVERRGEWRGPDYVKSMRAIVQHLEPSGSTGNVLIEIGEVVEQELRAIEASET
jgi:Glyoxalase/Bleomycin resistance protein/Dioxygenase superfamily.